MGSELTAELLRAATERRTGVLCVGDGAFHFTDGAINGVDCQRAPGLDRLLGAAGLSRTPGPRLETLALLAVFDAAYFLLVTPGAPEFRPAPAHWLATVCRVPPHGLMRECARRERAETGPWGVELVDRAPVRPVGRIRRHRVLLTGHQTEVLAVADGRRSVTGIAEQLGRTSYGCLAAVRELTAAGLIEPPARDPAESGLPRRLTRRELIAPPDDRWHAADRDLLVRLRTALKELD
ncbi:hypothetical protein ACFVMC_16510 [Nocardia sp. NPDC127579]|uniref:hypothetical protein n=1 Tax=Nocardia sp. NPDC127579 TaxID=3345402 RepID=UPI00363C42FF